MDIKSTFKIYKLENDDVKENNQRIEGIDYQITDGNNQTYTINVDNNATFHANGELSNFSFAEVDEETISSSNYTLENGSTIITLKKDFMDTLEYNKEHTINIVYKDGGEASTSFNVLLAGTVEYKLGDMNMNNRIDLADIIILLRKYLNDDATSTELRIGDMNQNNRLDLADIILLLRQYLSN